MVPWFVWKLLWWDLVYHYDLGAVADQNWGDESNTIIQSEHAEWLDNAIYLSKTE